MEGGSTPDKPQQVETEEMGEKIIKIPFSLQRDMWVMWNEEEPLL